MAIVEGEPMRHPSATPPRPAPPPSADDADSSRAPLPVAPEPGRVWRARLTGVSSVFALRLDMRGDRVSLQVGWFWMAVLALPLLASCVM